VHGVFETLTHAIAGAPGVALGAAFAWGMLSILLSPCHLASIPLIVGFIDGQGRTSIGRAFWISLLFASGILLTIAAIGMATSVAGRMLGDLGPVTSYLVAAILIVVGLYLLEVFPWSWSNSGRVGLKGKGMFAALMLGLVFGLALGPCTFAYMAPMLAVTFRLASTAMLYGWLLLLMYGLGHCSVIVIAGTSTEWVQQYLNWNERSRGAIALKRLCGVLVIFAGLYLLYTTR
jgi:cytochrome c-type biogenesis protein